MNDATTYLCGLSSGASLIYFFDPVSGKRRRAMLRGQVVRLLHQLDQCLDATWSDTRQRARGIAASARSIMGGDEGMPTDRALTARVRSKLGRYCSHPHAIHVWARGGR